MRGLELETEGRSGFGEVPYVPYDGSGWPRLRQAAFLFFSGIHG